MLPFKLVYSADYYLPIGSHVFPAEKYKYVHDRLLALGTAEPSDFAAPRPATDEDVLLVHTQQYVQKLKTGTLSAREKLELEVPYSPELVRAFGLRPAALCWPLIMRSTTASPSTLAEDSIMPSPITAKVSACSTMWPLPSAACSATKKLAKR